MITLNFKPFPVLETERLILREIKKDDAPALFKIRSNKEVMKFIDRPLAQTIADVQALIKLIIDGISNDSAITWAITLKGDTTLIGTIGFWQVHKEHYRAEIGYSLLTEFQQKGLMQEAMDAALNYGFTMMQLHSVEANVNLDNTASIRLLENNHFVREAYFKENYYFDGRFLDSAIYSLLKPL